MEIFQYAFMRRAFVVGLLLSLILPLVGVVIVLKRLSMIGDALSHTSLAGVAAGLLFNLSPILGASVFSVAAAFSIEAIRRKIPKYAELSIAIVMSAGVALSGVLSGFVRNSSSFSGFLFGSIVAISDGEFFAVIITSIIIMLLFALFYREFYYLALDERGARLVGIKTGFFNSLFTIMVAVTVSVSARSVGALIVSSMMVLPVSCALETAKSYKQTVAHSVLFAEAFTIVGLLLSFYSDTRPGATIVLVGVVVLIVLLALKSFFKRA